LTDRLELAALIPDEPRWIDLKGLLRSERLDVWTEAVPAHGFIACSWDYPFASLYGDPKPDLIRAATAAGRAAFDGLYPTEEWQLLAPPDARATVGAALPGWQRKGIALHRWARSLDWSRSDSEVEIRLLPEGHRSAKLDLGEVPESSRRELLLDWVATRPMAVAIIDSHPVTFCYAAFTTETLWDVSIETLEPYRRRGLAASCFLALAAYMAEQGKTPTWGADFDNPASLGLAAKLGFVRDASLDGWFEKED
jgi:GNAT superfamily N-acetyltransferase